MREQHYKLKVGTVEMAQKVIEKQMMVAQEIAGPCLAEDNGRDESYIDES